MTIGARGKPGRDERLRSWKEIAAFFGADERTVRRWEVRGLPVRRVPGGARATVYAEVAELETWLKGQGRSPTVAKEVRAPSHLLPVVAAGLVALLAVAGATFSLSRAGAFGPGSAVHHQPPQVAVDLYLAGTYNWERRTPESLRRAVDLFGRAIAEDPAYAEAYAGLANTYLLLREYSVMPDTVAYPRARDAAERALTLDPSLADAHAAFAFVTFFWTRDWARGLNGFERATELDRSSAGAWHWYGTALYHAGRVDEALRAIGEAQRLEPTSRSIIADRALIAFHAGRTAESITTLRQLGASEPEFYSPHAYLASIYLAQHDFAGSLREAAIAARLKGNPDQMAMVGRAEDGFRRAGGRGMLEAMLEEELRLRRAGHGSDYELAALHASLGHGEASLRLLTASDEAGETAFVSIRMDPRFSSLHGDPRFQQLAERVARPSPRKA